MPRNETEPNGTLSARHEQAASLLASGRTKAETCRLARVGKTTLFRWLKDPTFRERVAELRQEIVDRAVSRLADLMAGKAVDTLTGLLTEKSAAVRLDSVKAVFDLFVNVTDATDLRQQVEEFKAQQHQQARGRR